MSPYVVTVYSKPSCGQCVATKRSLQSAGVPFVEADLQEPGNLATAKGLGHLQAPVVTVEKKDSLLDHWSGFRPDLIDQLVQERGLGKAA